MDTMPIDQISIGSRYREDFGDLDALAASIEHYGLLAPVIVTRTGELIAGERRFRAIKLLKWTDVPVIFKDELTPLQLKEIELEENIQRKQLTWQEEVKAKAELDRIKREIYGEALRGRPMGGEKKGWGLRDTAIALSENISIVHRDIKLAAGLERFPELAQEGSRSVAYRKLKAFELRAAEAELARRHSTKLSETVLNMVRLGDCRMVVKEIPDDSIGLILTDPPFGINLDQSAEATRQGFSAYDHPDTEEFILGLLEEISKDLYRILIPGHCMFLFYGTQHYNKVYDMFTNAGFRVDPIPLVWNKITPAMKPTYKAYLPAYENFFFMIKAPARELMEAQPNVFSFKRVAPSAKIHPLEKPTRFLRKLIENTTVPGESVFDPFCGSASTLVAALQLGRVPLGVEINEDYRNRAVDRLSFIQGTLDTTDFIRQTRMDEGDLDLADEENEDVVDLPEET